MQTIYLHKKFYHIVKPSWAAASFCVIFFILQFFENNKLCTFFSAHDNMFHTGPTHKQHQRSLPFATYDE